jgi:transcription termination factor NusB
MSFNNADIDTNTNNNWTTVSSGWSKNRSQQLINNSRSSSPNVPVLQTDSPVTAEMSFPVTSSSPTIDFVNDIKSIRPPIDFVAPDQETIKNKTITIDSIQQSQTPPIMQTPIMNTQNSAFNMPTARFDNWKNTLENLRIQYGLIKHSIKLIEYEMGFPPELRGKTPEEKDEIISKTVYDITVEHLAKIKPVLINCKKWVDTIKPSKITGMLLENCTLKEKYQLSSNKDEICKLVMEACDVLYDAFIPTTQKAKPIPIPKKEITITQEPVPFAPKKEEHDVTFTFEQRTEHKAALHAAQEKFYDMVKPIQEEADDLKEKIKPLTDWEDCIKRINVSDDAIVIDDKYTFSKKHFLNNTWFIKRMKKDYGKMYEMNIRIHMDKTFLVITGKKCEYTI